MSVRFDNAADELKTTTNIVGTSPFTMMCWAKIKVAPGAGASGCFLSAGNSTNTNYFELSIDTSRVLGLWNGIAAVTGSTLLLNQWYHLAMVAEGTGAGQLKAYLNGRLDFSSAGNAAPTMNAMTVGTSVDSADDLNGCICAAGIWDYALSAGQILQQMRYGYPRIRPEKLNRFLPMRTAATARVDGSVKLRHMTIGGALTTETDPPFLLWQADWLLPAAKARAAGAAGLLRGSLIARPKYVLLD